MSLQFAVLCVHVCVQAVKPTFRAGGRLLPVSYPRPDQLMCLANIQYWTNCCSYEYIHTWLPIPTLSHYRDLLRRLGLWRQRVTLQLHYLVNCITYKWHAYRINSPEVTWTPDNMQGSLGMCQGSHTLTTSVTSHTWLKVLFPVHHATIDLLYTLYKIREGGEQLCNLATMQL